MITMAFRSHIALAGALRYIFHKLLSGDRNNYGTQKHLGKTSFPFFKRIQFVPVLPLRIFGFFLEATKTLISDEF